MPKQKVLCALSGGVDSSVAALLLKKGGYEVIGVYFNLWTEKTGKNENRCCSGEAVASARMVAAKLKIKFYNLNLKEIFRQKVVNDYLKNYEKGKTPNPCVICNKDIKFNKLLKLSRELEADKIATGHYAQIQRKGNQYQLLRARDKDKDQSYFLWRLNYSDLNKIILPLGNLKKTEVRRIAQKAALPTYNQRESQGLCFIGATNKLFLRKTAKKLLQAGNVADDTGRIIGQHTGLIYYTIGQRGGFEVADDKWRRAGVDIPPLYVKNIIITENLLVVSENSRLYAKKCVIKDVNWLIRPKPKSGVSLNLLAQIRYRHSALRCSAAISKSKAQVLFSKPERAITPGQSCVFYQGKRAIGGGIIDK